MEKRKIRTTLKEGEYIIHIAKKHMIILLIPLLIILLTIYISYTAPEAISKVINPTVPYVIGISLVYFIYAFLDRMTNIFAVTNYRVIREWGIISYNVMENSLDKIHNVGVMQDFLGIIFGYGSLIIQTAAETNNKAEKFIANPRKFQSAVFKAQEDIKKGVKEHDIIECPYCAEKIKAKAKVCRFCNREIVSQEKENENNKINEIVIKEEVENKSNVIRNPRAFLRDR